MAVDEELILFIRSAIRSVWAVESLVLLRKEPSRVWTPEALAQELRSNPRLTSEILLGFVAVGLVQQSDDGYRYAPASPALDALSASLELAYRERPVSVVNAIVSSRTTALQTFANAFRLKGGTDKP